MKKILLLNALLVSVLSVTAQLTPNGNSGMSTTVYTSGAPNDPIYIWCSDVLSTMQGSLTATTANGTGPYTFNWFYHNQTNSSWTPYTTQTGATSTITGLASDGYRVEIHDAGNAIVDCYTAWVWNLNTQVTASATRNNCNQANLSSTINTTGSFSYYNPPPPQSLINATTQVQICFSATHTYVSDLAFYLVGPASCGSPTIALSPNPGALDSDDDVCNSGHNVSNLCFSTSSAANLNVCSASVPLTGTYGSYGSGTAINWSSLIGCNAAAGGWRVQIYDCIDEDVGALTNATIQFSNLTSICGSPTSISYTSGSINSAINDNSCSPGTASIFQVPLPTNLTTPITVNATTTLQWTSSAAISNPTNANTTATGLPVGSTDFIQTATTSFGTASCTADDTATITYALPVVGAGSDQTVCNGASATLSGSGAASYTWDNGVSNGVAFTPAATQTYTVTGTAADGCQNTDQVIVNVGTNPTVNAGIDQSVCPGASVTLSGAGATNYSWNNGVSDGVAFTPGSTQTYTVTGTDAAGCSNTDQVTVTVNTLPVVNAGTDQSVCQGGSVTLSGSGATSYTWDNSVNNGTAFMPASTQTYTVTGTDANGCQNTDQVVVTVNALPTVGAGTDQTVCQGGSVTLSGSGATNYTWDNSVTDGTAFTPASTQTYTVTGTNGNGCQSTDQVTVTVNSLPTVGAGTDQSVCQSGSVTLSGSGATSYSWNNSVNNGVAFTPASTQTYTVTGTDANGCVNTDQVTVTVNALPNVFAGADQAICPQGSVTLSGQGATSYSWNNSVNNGVAFTPASTQTYTVTGTDVNGCTNTDQAVVTVNPLPNVSAGIDQAICTAGFVTLSGSGASTYVWNNSVTNGVPFTPGATQIYTVVGTDANGCQNSDEVTVTVNGLPNVGAGTDQTICAGMEITLAGTGAATYTWSNSVTNAVAFTPATGSVTYTVTGTDANGCVNTDQVTVTVVPVPISDISSAGPLTGYPGLTVVFSNASQFATDYSWDFDNGSTSSSTDVNATVSSTFNTPGIYEVVLTASNGICQDDSQLEVIVIPFEPLVLHIPNVFTPDGDGVNDFFAIDAENAVSIEIVVVNRWGNVMAELNDLTAKWDGTTKGHDADEGVYIFKYSIKGKDGTTQTGQGFVELFR